IRQSNKRMNSNGKVVAAMLAGLAAGTVLGILFAPEKGSETRDKLGDSISDLGDILKERFEEQYEQLNDLRERVVSTLKAKSQEIEYAIDEDEIIEHA